MSTATDRGSTIRRYRPDDEPAARELYARVLGREMPEAVWRWKTRDRPGSPSERWVVVSATDEVVAHYAGIPVRIKLGGKIRDGMLSVDGVTALERQGEGLQTALVPVLYDAWRSAGIALTWAMLSNQWGGLLSRMGWAPGLPLQWLRAPLHLEQLLARQTAMPRWMREWGMGLTGVAAAAWHRRRRRRIDAGEGLCIEVMERPTAELDALWAAVQVHYENAVVRDRDWLTWRYFDAPGLGYRVLLARREREPVGYVVYRSREEGERRRGYIVDLFTAPAARPVAHGLIRAALDDLWRCGAETAQALAPVRSPMHALLRSAGFFPAAKSFGFTALAFDPSVREQLRDPASWLLSGGDFDVV